MVISIAIVSIALVSIFVYMSRPTEVEKLSQSSLDTVDEAKLKKHVDTKFNNTYLLKDYVYYGENLSLYKEAYGSSDMDKMKGNNIVLRNVESGSLMSFTYSGTADSGINVGSLKEGVYELYTYNHYEKERIYFDHAFKAKKFTTMRRNKKVKDVVLMADKDALKEYGIRYKKNYAFLVVTKHIPKAKVYDVVIDPCGNTLNAMTNTVDYGLSTSLLDEQATSLQFAQIVKEKLESYGLKVKILRKGKETPGYYGVDGRPSLGYKAKAKVYLALGASYDESITAPYMMVSPYTNSSLANTVAYAMNQSNTSLYAIQSDSTQESGVTYDTFSQDESGKNTKFEMYPQLRETGGKATYTGEYGDDVKNEAYKDAYGMNGLYFLYASANNEQSVQYFDDYMEDMAANLAKGIVTYYDIKG